MHKLKLYVSPLYIISSFIIIYLGGLNTFCYYFVTLVIHELSHYFMAKRLGYMLNNISFMPYGAKLNGETNFKNKHHETLVALSGPLSNLIFGLILISFWWLNPMLYAYTKEFVESNFIMGFFNLLPLFPLDGGQVFLNIFSTSKSKKIAYKIMQMIGVIVSGIFLILFILSAFNTLNFSLFFISIFMFVTSVTPYNVDIKNTVENLQYKVKDVCETKIYFVNENVNFLKLAKYISANTVSIFTFVDNKYNKISTLTQYEILDNIGRGKYFLK